MTLECENERSFNQIYAIVSGAVVAFSAAAFGAVGQQEQATSKFQLRTGQSGLTASQPHEEMTAERLYVQRHEKPSVQELEPVPVTERPRDLTDNPLYLMRVRDVVGREVVNTQSKEIGEIVGLVIDKRTEGLEAVVALDGISSVTSKKVAVPIGWLQLQNDKIATLMTEEQLRSAAEYDSREATRIREQDSLLSKFVFTNTVTQPGSATP